MKAKISTTLIKSLEPNTTPYDVRDTQLTGFMLRVQPSGYKSYVCNFGRGKRFTIGSADRFSPAQAREEAKKILAKSSLGQDPRQDKKRAKAKTFEDYIDNIYGPWIEGHRKMSTEAIARIKRFDDLLKKKLHEITAWQVEKWQLKRKRSGIKPSTINRDITELKAALSKAVVWEFIAENPITKVKPLRVDSNPSVRYLTIDEETSLRKTLFERDEEIKAQRKSANSWRKSRGYDLYSDFCNHNFGDHLTPMTLLSLNTGMRRGEIFSLKWVDVNFDSKYLTVQGATAKSNKTRHIPLNEEAMAILKAWQSQNTQSELVFPSKNGEKFVHIKTSWAGVLDAANITNFRWHDIRHTFASNLVMAGVDLNTVRELLGHSNIDMTLRYAHLAPEIKANAVSKLVAIKN
jgi:integrase